MNIMIEVEAIPLSMVGRYAARANAQYDAAHIDADLPIAVR
jgi:hypothetical protein